MNSKRKIFCLPYAGGSASIYNSWRKYPDYNIELIPLELAGRGDRIDEPLYNELEEAIEDILKIMMPIIKDSNYSLFGHSMGAMLTYELANRITIAGLRTPEHLFFSGKGAPNIEQEKEKLYHLMDDKEFIEELLTLGGTPIEIFKCNELKEFFLPLLRSDFNLAATDFSQRKITPFECDITVLIGKKETISDERVGAWKHHTQGICSICFLNGGHFFINKEGKQIMKIINEKLTFKKER